MAARDLTPGNSRFQDLTGVRFGLLVVQRLADVRSNGERIRWECLCDCGQSKDIIGNNLKRGLTQSCGCLRKIRPYRDLTGQVFGQLTVLAKVQGTDGKPSLWVCRCECGNEKAIQAGALTHGLTVSCGCWGRKARGLSATTHGKTRSRTYRIWMNMRGRCDPRSSQADRNYAGRGIVVCQRWLDSFRNFLDDMGECPEGMSIDRLDNEAGYFPGNCRWATMKEQANNKYNNVYIEHEGSIMTIAQWADATGIPGDAIRRRIKRGWGVKDALTIPSDRRNSRRRRGQKS